MRAAAYNNPNRPGTHLPRKIAPHRPSFLIHCPELETNLTCTKQTADDISNRQFFAFLKLPDTLPPGSFSRTDRPLPRAGKALHTTGNRERLIANDLHSPANANALQCATSIFLIGNEFQLKRASRKNPHPSQTALPSFVRVNRMGHPTNGRGEPRPYEKRKADPCLRQAGLTPFAKRGRQGSG